MNQNNYPKQFYKNFFRPPLDPKTQNEMSQKGEDYKEKKDNFDETREIWLKKTHDSKDHEQEHSNLGCTSIRDKHAEILKKYNQNLQLAYYSDHQAFESNSTIEKRGYLLIF